MRALIRLDREPLWQNTDRRYVAHRTAPSQGNLQVIAGGHSADQPDGHLRELTPAKRAA